MWRASGSAVELAQDINKMTLQERLAQQVKEEPLTYSDPKIKRTSGLGLPAGSARMRGVDASPREGKG